MLDALFDVQVDGHWVLQVRKVGEAQGRGRCVFGSGLGQARELGVRRGNEHDVGGRLAQVYGLVVVDGAGLGVQEVHGVLALCWARVGMSCFWNIET